jgi:hypothetical protein
MMVKTHQKAGGVIYEVEKMESSIGIKLANKSKI